MVNPGTGTTSHIGGGLDLQKKKNSHLLKNIQQRFDVSKCIMLIFKYNTDYVVPLSYAMSSLALFAR